MEKPYRLSACLYGHSLDVRALAVTPNDEILSGSRDRTTKLWKPNGFNTTYSETISYKDQKNFVASVIYLEATSENPEGLVITGGNDSQILIYKLSEPTAVCNIKEHSDTVSCLAKGIQPNTFMSGSWDATVKYWVLNTNSKSQTSLVTLKGHAAAIWSVIQLQDSRIVTASADKNICVWNLEGKLLQTLKGHTDCVRGLCDMPESNFFLSVSNDASIKIWSYSGENLNTLYGHTNYIYCIARCKDGSSNCFVTSDEDRTVRVWRNGENTQMFQLPAQSVWAVAMLNNGDIVTGSSDGVVRIFTQEESRLAEACALANFEEEVASVNAQQLQEIGGYKVSDLPGKEALYEPGKKAGQMKMIRESGGVVAYTWVIDGENNHWEKVGDVLGAKDKANEGKTMFDGQPYDFVFSVDVEDGKPPLKLPYNTGDDPYKAAQAFLSRNALPSVYLEQVVDFILKNSKQQFTPTVNNDYVDPFTGGSRYTPAGNNSSQFQGANLDPFTGGSSYSTGSSAPINMDISTGANADPFTGGMSYTTNTTQTSSYFPQKQYLSFDVGDPNVILNKLKEFNQKIGDGSNIEEQHLEEFVLLCKGFPSNPNVFDILFKLLEWPEDMIFPALDVVRMAVRHKQNNEIIATLNSEALLNRLKYFIGEKCVVVNNTIVALRTFSNLCLHPAGEALIFENRFDIVENITSLGGMNKNVQIALSTLLLNLTILSQRKSDEVGTTVLIDVIEDLLSKLSDPESQFRAYVALGTILISNLLCKEFKLKLKTSSNFCRVLDTHAAECNNEIERKRMECAKDVKKLL